VNRSVGMGLPVGTAYSGYAAMFLSGSGSREQVVSAELEGGQTWLQSSNGLFLRGMVSSLGCGVL
jgi:hypothetical protein